MPLSQIPHAMKLPPFLILRGEDFLHEAPSELRTEIEKVLERLPKPTTLLGGPLEYELWFGGVLRALLDARTASNEWLEHLSS